MLEQALSTLRQMDSQRMLAYTLTFAADVDLKYHRTELAIARAEAAFRAAQIVDHPSEIALAEATLIRGRLQHGDHKTALQSFKNLQQRTNLYAVSARARVAIQQLGEQLEEI
jgi:hypothetical protein